MIEDENDVFPFLPGRTAVQPLNGSSPRARSHSLLSSVNVRSFRMSTNSDPPTGADTSVYGGSGSNYSSLRRSSSTELSPLDSDPNSPRTRLADIFSASLVSSAGYVHIEDNPESSAEHENVTSQALYRCKQKVLKPYLRLLSLLGWHPIVGGHSSKCWVRVINALYPFFVMAIILLGYIVQYALCYRRLPNRFDKKEAQREVNYTFNSTELCHNGLFSNYIIPDVLHAAAFLYSFYVIRWKENEHLVTLMERVFLQTSSSHSGWMSQPRLIRSLRFLLFFNVVWVLCSIAGHSLHLTALTFGIEHRYNPQFQWFNADGAAHYVLLVFLLAGLSAMDIVYASVMTNYAIQCHLLITHMRCTMVRTRQKLVSLHQSMKDITDESQYLRTLNDKVATAVSLLVFSVSSMLILRVFDVINSPPEALFFVANTIRAVVILALLALPLVQACRVTNAGYALQRLGSEIAVRPFGYQDTPSEDIYMFQLFTSSLQPRAKLFRVPFHTSWVTSICLSLTFALLISLQLDLIKAKL
ncbi:uncharacterized protein LOC135806095 isoform X2 [Sycon ciliatum]|uniref:uncharacterized protein LOC135806095 isoform X2 n=1 Tax=Sycon ciliatum TaxID=27933 RepID=UPI0020AE157F|eukprot:scpid50077/ scgid0982/ 